MTQGPSANTGYLRGVPHLPKHLRRASGVDVGDLPEHLEDELSDPSPRLEEAISFEVYLITKQIRRRMPRLKGVMY